MKRFGGFLTKKIYINDPKKIIYGYDIYHIMRFADLNHYKNTLKRGNIKLSRKNRRPTAI
jgi:hypothetical protein